MIKLLSLPAASLLLVLSFFVLSLPFVCGQLGYLEVFAGEPQYISNTDVTPLSLPSTAWNNGNAHASWNTTSEIGVTNTDTNDHVYDFNLWVTCTGVTSGVEVSLSLQGTSYLVTTVVGDSGNANIALTVSTGIAAHASGFYPAIQLTSGIATVVEAVLSVILIY